MKMFPFQPGMYFNASLASEVTIYVHNSKQECQSLPTISLLFQNFQFSNIRQFDIADICAQYEEGIWQCNYIC